LIHYNVNDEIILTDSTSFAIARTNLCLLQIVDFQHLMCKYLH